MANTNRLTTMVIAARAAASCGRPPGCRAPHHHDGNVRSSGATSRAPAASPSHQIHHNSVNSDHGWTPDTLSVTTPMVASIAVLITADARINAVT